MDRVGPAVAGHADDLLDREIGGDWPHPFTDAIGLVGLEPVQAQLVLVGKDRDGALAQLIGGAHDADGDLAPVGDQDFREVGHGLYPRLVTSSATRGDAALRRCDLVGFVKGLRNPAFWVFAGWGNFLPRRVGAPTRQGQGRRRSLAGLFLCFALGRLAGFFLGLGRGFVVRLGLFLVGLLVLGFFGLGLGLFLVSLFGLGLLRVRLFLIRLFLAALLRRGFLALLPGCLARCLGLCLGGAGGGGRRPLGQRRGGVDEAPRAIR